MSLKKHQSNSYSHDGEHDLLQLSERRQYKLFLPPLKSTSEHKKYLNFHKNDKILLFQPNRYAKSGAAEQSQVALPSNKLSLIKGSYYAKDSFTPKTMEPPLYKFVPYKKFDPSSFSQEEESFQLSKRKPINLTQDSEYEPARAQNSLRSKEYSNLGTPRLEQIENNNNEDIFRLTLNQRSLPMINPGLGDFNNFSMERNKNSRDAEQHDSFKLLYRDIITNHTNPDPYAFSAEKTKELLQRVSKLQRINKKKNKIVYRANDSSDIEAEDSLKEVPLQKKASLLRNLKVKNIQLTPKSSNVENPIRKNLANIVPDEDYGYDGATQEVAFKKYYKKAEEMNLKLKRQEHLAKLQKINKIKAKIKQQKVDNNSNANSLIEIKQKNAANFEKFIQDKLLGLRSIVNKAKNQVDKQDHQFETLLQNFKNDYGILD